MTPAAGQPARAETGAGAEATVSAVTEWGATVTSIGEPCRRASSSRLPPQRTRVTVAGSPGVIDKQLAAIGWSVLAATWASTSLPRSVPGPTTALGAVRSMSSTIAWAHAAGA